MKAEEQVLKIGILPGELLPTLALKEILGHQGVLFEEVKNGKRYPVVLVLSSERKGEGEKYCIDSSGILDLTDPHLERIAAALSGGLKSTDGRLIGPVISGDEKRLAEAIMDKFKDFNLPFIRKWFWPDFEKACSVVTHDIDGLDYVPPIRKSKLERMKYILFKTTNKGYAKSNVYNIMNEELKMEYKSSFYIFSDYPGYEKKYLEVLKDLREHGFEVAYHSSEKAFEDADAFAEEKKKIERDGDIKLIGHRAHKLNFRIPDTWLLLERHGFLYDATFSYNEKFGFRAGISHPYRPLDVKRERVMDLLELPTSFMDWTAFYHEMGYDDIIKVITSLMEMVEEYSGCLVTIFHNMYTNERTFPDIMSTFKYVLKETKERDYWCTTAEACARWWTRRERAEVKAAFANGKVMGETDTLLPLVIIWPDGRTEQKKVKGKFVVE